MSFDIILVDTNVLSVSKSNTVMEITDATNALARYAKDSDYSKISGDMKLVLDKLQDNYGTLREPKAFCPWAAWPPGVSADGQLVTLSVGWNAGTAVLKYAEKISSNTSIAVINPQPPETPRKNIMHEKDKLLGKSEKSGLSVYLKMGRFGPIFQYGGFEEIDNPVIIALCDDMNFDFESATLADADEIATLPKVIGQDSNGDDVLSGYGRELPYVKYMSKFYGSKSINPLTITLDEALNIIKDENIEPNWRVT